MWQLFKKTEQRSITPDSDLNSYFLARLQDKQLHGGITSDEAVLNHPIVRRGVSLISNLAGTLPLNVIKQGGIAGRETDKNHPWQYRLNVRPTGFCDRFTWMQTLLKDAIVYGNGYNLIEGDRLTWLDPKAVHPEVKNGELIYRFILNAENRTVSQDRMIHIRSMTHNTITGESLADAMLDSMASALAKNKHIRRYFENGTFSNLVWTLPDSVKGEEKVEEFKRRVDAKYSGLFNSFKNIFISQGGKVEPLTVDNNAAQTRELMEFDIIVIAAALNLPPAALGANQNTSYASLEIEDKKMLRDINPWLVSVEQQLTSKLMTEDDLISGDRWIEFNRKASVQMDSVTELDLLTKGMQSGIYSKEFVRNKLNVPIEDIDKETYFFPTNLTSYKGGEEPVTAQNEPPEPLSAPDEATETEEPQDEPDERLERLTRVSLDRLIERIASSKEPAKSHSKIWNENLGMFARSEEVLQELANLIDGATDSRKTIAQNINKDIWITKLLKQDIQA